MPEFPIRTRLDVVLRLLGCIVVALLYSLLIAELVEYFFEISNIWYYLILIVGFIILLSLYSTVMSRGDISEIERLEELDSRQVHEIVDSDIDDED